MLGGTDRRLPTAVRAESLFIRFPSRQTNPAELPTRVWREEISIGSADVRPRRRNRAAAQDELIAHEFAVVFPQRARRRPIAGIGEIRAARPLPYFAEHLLKRRASVSDGD